MILLIDNYDSFTYNLYQYLAELDGDVEVRRNDGVEEGMIERATHIVISPGPGSPLNPRDFGVCGDVIRNAKVPVLGVCLGHQGLGMVFGASVVPAGRIMHGKTSRISHSGEGIFAGVPQHFKAARYHSLALDSVGSPLEVIAEAEDGEVMAIRHSELPFYGVQFHPESVMTEHGMQILANFLS